MSPRFEYDEGFTVIGLSVCFKPGGNKVIGERLWPDFMIRIEDVLNASQQGFENLRTYGLCKAVNRNMDEFIYYAAAKIPPDSPTPEGLTKIDVAPAYYVVFEHASGLGHLNETMSFIYDKWLPNSEHVREAGFELEVYPPDFDPLSPNAQLEIWVPVKAD